MASTAVVRAFAAAVALAPRAFAASLCMDVPAGSGQFDNVQIWGCNGQANQRWEMQPIGKDSSLYQISSSSSDPLLGNLCLRLADASDGSLVDLVDCVDLVRGLSGWWHFSEGQIRPLSDSSKCLDASDPMSEGNWLKVWSCNQQPQQMWGYDGDQMTIYLSDSRRLGEVQDSESYVAV